LRRILVGYVVAVVLAPIVLAIGVWLYIQATDGPTGVSDLVQTIFTFLIVGVPIAAVALAALAIPMQFLIWDRLDPRRWHALVIGALAGAGIMLLLARPVKAGVGIGALAGAVAALAFWAIARPDVLLGTGKRPAT
jgi:hypothetical protein